VELALKVEESFRFPQDIEWGFEDGAVYVLQSRPVTTIPPRWTRDESAERYPNAITPLTWDFVDAGFHESLKYSFRLMGLPAYDGKWFAAHNHYVYGNQNAVELYGRRAPLGIGSLTELAAALPGLAKRFRWVQELPDRWYRDLDHHLVQMGRFTAQPLDKLSESEIWDFVREVNEHGTRYFLPNIAISITQSALYQQLRALLNVAIGEAAAARLFPDVTGYCRTKTGAINAELYELVQMIRSEPRLADLIRTGESRGLIRDGALQRFPEFHRRLEKLLRDHGHREVEFDAYYPTWIDAPWVVLDNLKQLLQNDALEDPADKERRLKARMQAAERSLFDKLPRKFHFFFSELLRLTREYTRLDDLEHYHTTRLTVPVRRGLLELGRRFARRGVVGEPRDIFFAHEKQISAALSADSDSGWRTLRDQVGRQKAAFFRDKARAPEWVLGEEDVRGWQGDSLCGIPGSPGQAEGAVYRVDGADDFAGFPQGAVLIARTTNPSWTPMFYSACAVVTESGGPLSHGAVTAREAGIPAVMSVRGSMSKLANGQRVRVDGTRGLVFCSARRRNQDLEISQDSFGRRKQST
jgi:pyruvate,water dikinase